MLSLHAQTRVLGAWPTHVLIMAKGIRYKLSSLFFVTAYLAVFLSIGLIARWLVVEAQRPGIHFAAEQGDTELVRQLLENGVSPTTMSAYQTTPLMNASVQGHSEVVILLLDSGASVNERSRMNRTPLMWAARNGHIEVVKLLLQRGASVELLDVEGKSAADLAELHGHSDVLDLLTRQIDSR